MTPVSGQMAPTKKGERVANSEVRRKGRILVADDDQSTLKLLKIYLESSGYEVVRAVDGREALDLIQALEPDLAILDVLMPVMSGYEVCTILRDQPNTASMPLILLSALGEVTDEVQGLGFGADEYITKPVALPELGARVEALLRRAKQVPPAQPS
jgi:DNA-binding response OmpR family regulator